ncbi:MAG: efflux RND transporter periplasmic adaptor subunit [Planctomycetota bacterium]
MHAHLRRLAGHLPTIAAFGLLAALAVWGHRTGWKLSPATPVDPAQSEDWCEAHNVPDSRCLACHPELGGGNPADWCKEHGVPESKCTTCHPEILTSGQAQDWCREHGVPESQCTTCHPEVAVVGSAPPSEVQVVASGSEDPPAQVMNCQTHQIRVQFASPAAVTKAGVTLAQATTRPMADTVRAPGEVGYDRTRLAQLASRAPGVVHSVAVEVGERIARGQLLALVDSADVGRAKAELLEAIARLDVAARRFERLRSTPTDVVTRSTLEDAEAQVREARVRQLNAEQALANLGLAVRASELAGLDEVTAFEQMRFLGLPQAEIASLRSEVTTANLLPISAPFDGVVIGREVVQGETVDPERVLLTVADVSRMWVTLSLPGEDQERVALGQRLTFRPDGAGFSVTGSVSWIATEIDETTRTLQLRAVVDGAEGRLRAGAFGTGRVMVRDAPEAVVVPDEAIHWEGCCHVVFVRLTDDIFQTRKVRLGARGGGLTEVTVGLVPGEVVAARGSHVLKSELLKSKLGAGCVDD